VLHGLRDPFAPAPDEYLERFRLSTQDVEAHWASFQDLSPQFVEQRLYLWLKPPATVKLSVRDNILYVSGLAEQVWINKAMSTIGLFGIVEVRSELLDRAGFLEQQAQKWLSPPETVKLKVVEDILYLRGHAPLHWKERVAQVLTAVPDLKQVDTSELLDTDSFLLQQAELLLKPPESVSLQVNHAVLTLRGRVDTATFEAIRKKLPNLKGFTRIKDGFLLNEDKVQQLVHAIANNFIYFGDDNQLAANQETKLSTLLNLLQALLEAHREQSVIIQIIGYTDGTGTRVYNVDLSERRAQVVYDWLIGHGLPSERAIIVYPLDIRSDEARSDMTQRKVGIRVIR
jgi:flagellar motor protein MotB